MKLQKLGGYAAIASVCANMAVVVFYILIKKRFGDFIEPVKEMAAVSAAPSYLYTIGWQAIIVSILWLIVFFALHERMQAKAPLLTRIALIAASAGTAISVTYYIIRIKGIGMIFPTQDISAYRAWDAIAAGLQSMSYHAYGWAFLLIGCAALRTHAFSQLLGWLVILAGILWLPATGPELMNMIPYNLIAVSFVWIGIALLRQKESQTVPGEKTA